MWYVTRMAFRRRSASRGPSTRTLAVRKANKRRTWETSHLNLCQVSTSVWDPDEESCYAYGSFDLVPASVVKDLFSDSVRIKRIVGTLNVKPAFNFPDSGSSLCEQTSVAELTGLFCGTYWLGLRRYESTSQDLTGPLLKPLENSDDYSESHWIDTWEHVWWPNFKVSRSAFPEGSVIGVCSDTEGSGGASAPENAITWTGTEGALDTEIEIETTCYPMASTGCVGAQTSFESSMPGSHKFTLDKRFKRGVPLRENQGLQLYYGFGPHMESTFHVPNAAWVGFLTGFDYVLNVKVKYEY